MMIDLNVCSPGQVLELRNGDIASYVGLHVNKNPLGKEFPEYRHLVELSYPNGWGDLPYPSGWGRLSYQVNGRYGNHSEPQSIDIVKILPMDYSPIESKVSYDCDAY